MRVTIRGVARVFGFDGMIGEFGTGATSSEVSDEDDGTQSDAAPFADNEAAMQQYGNMLDGLPDLTGALGETSSEIDSFIDAADAAPTLDSLTDTTDPVPGLPGDWLYENDDTEVLDYDAETESLILVWDDLAEGANEPEVSVEEDPFDEDVRQVMMNGKSVAEVYGDPNLNTADITVMPLSSALIVGLEPA